MKRAVLVIALVGFGCEKPEAHVECVGSDKGYDCTVTHAKGGTGLDVCWDIALSCGGGFKTDTRVCAHVEPKSSAKQFVPTAAFPEMDRCKSIDSADVANIHAKLN
jgi:hypothetical protein